MISLKLTRAAMACDFEIVLFGDDRGYLVDAGNQALDEVQRLDEQLSRFNPSSEVSFVNAEAWARPVPVEPGLFRLLQLAQEVWRDTAGAFDVTVAPLADLWREAEHTGQNPSKKAIGEAAAKIGMNNVILDESRNAVGFAAGGISLDLGAVGKGFAAGRAAAVLRESGIESALVSAGRSTVCAVGAPPGEDAWAVGIRHPWRFDQRVTMIRLRDRAMSTSGGIEQRDEAVAEKFDHIIDPVTGRGARSTTVSATVVADDPAVCDALSTAFYARGEALARTYCTAHPSVTAIFVVIDQSTGEPIARRIPEDHHD